MRLSIQKRERVVTIYINQNLHFKRNRFQLLKQLSTQEDIFASDKTMRRIVTRWQLTGRFCNEESATRRINKTEITKRQMTALDRLVLRRHGISAATARDKLRGLRVST